MAQVPRTTRRSAAPTPAEEAPARTDAPRRGRKPGPNRTADEKAAATLKRFQERLASRKGKTPSSDVVERRENPVWSQVRKIEKLLDETTALISAGQLVTEELETGDLLPNLAALKKDLRDALTGVRIPE